MKQTLPYKYTPQEAINLCVTSWTKAFALWKSICLHKAMWFQQCGILTSVDSDWPVQPPFKLKNSKSCSVSSMHRLILGFAGRI